MTEGEMRAQTDAPNNEKTQLTPQAAVSFNRATNGLAILASGVFFVALTGYALAWGIHNEESELEKRVAQRFAAADIDTSGLNVKFSGRDGVIAGQVRYASDIHYIQRAANVSGVRHLSVSAEPRYPLPENPALTLRHNGGKMDVGGLVGTTGHHHALLADIAEAFPGVELVDSVSVAVTDAQWLKRDRGQLFRAVSQLETLSLRVSDNQVMIEGAAASAEIKREIDKSLSEIFGRKQIVNRINVRVPSTLSAASRELSRLARIDDWLTVDGKMREQSSSMRSLAFLMRGYPQLRIRIVANTQREGNAARATIIAKRLQAVGIDGKRVETIAAPRGERAASVVIEAVGEVK